MVAIRDRLRLDRVRPKREDVPDDVGAAVVLGVESVPDGLASGILAGVNPVAGLYAYMFGVASAALFTSTAFMAVQGTGAMAIIIADVDLASSDDPTRALVTLSVITGLMMAAAGLLKLGSLLRFVSNPVMVGFISAVGVNIVLGQVGDFTGYASSKDGRIARTIDTILHPGRLDVWTVVVGMATIVLILTLRRTRLGAMGMVVAIIAGSGMAAIIRALDREITLVGNVAEVPNRLPTPSLPVISEIPMLIVPALSLAFVGLVQGAGASAAFVNPDGSHGDVSSDFVGQGVGNVTSGVFQGMPVGGSMSASSLITSAGAKSRWALVYTFGVMAVVVVLFAGAVEYIAMPALAGLLIVVGVETVKPHDLYSVYRTTSFAAGAMVVTFALTLVIPLQYSVLVGVGMSMLLYIVRQSNSLHTVRFVPQADGGIDEVEVPDEVPAHDVVVLQPYGSLFFAAAPAFEDQLPAVTPDSVGSVVVLRFRGKPDLGATLLDVLERYNESLLQVGSKMMIVTDSTRIIDQLDATGAADRIGRENLYPSTNRLLGTVISASSDAQDWVASQLPSDTDIADTPIADLTLGDLTTDATLTIDEAAVDDQRTADLGDNRTSGPERPATTEGNDDDT